MTNRRRSLAAELDGHSRQGRSLSEAVVDSAAHLVFVEVDIVRRGRTAAQSAIEVAEIDVEIFDLGAPRPADRILGADAGGPAELRRVRASEARVGHLDVVDVRPVHVSFEAEYSAAELQMVADGTAGQSTRRVGVPGQIRMRAAPAPAAVDAEIKAVPCKW